jgi:aminopeptidase-like protein
VPETDRMTSRRHERERLEGDFRRLFPLHRSITGDGLRASLDIVGETIPLRRVEVPSGTRVFDWEVPEEWSVNEAYVIDPRGNRILDVKTHNLHLLNYSAPFKGTVSRAELDEHLFSRPDLPDAIPYAISYYARQWGFCLPHAQRLELPDGDYEVFIDTAFTQGSLSYGDCVLPGTSTEEVLFSSYLCHPQMASHELSGPLTLAALYARLKEKTDRRLTYRFFLGPETIGTICYLSEIGEQLSKVLKAGLVVSCAGDRAAFSYKKTAAGTAIIDRVIQQVALQFAETDGALRVLPFDPLGSDERQYGSPGFKLDVGVFGRSLFGSFPEYHTSLDDASVIDFDKIQTNVDFLERVSEFLEQSTVYHRLDPFCEPQLSRYPGLYPTVGGLEPVAEQRKALMWALNCSDGTNDVTAIAERSGLAKGLIEEAIAKCLEFGLIAEGRSESLVRR